MLQVSTYGSKKLSSSKLKYKQAQNGASVRVKEPLGLPKGSVRAIITLATLMIFLTAVLIAMVYGKVIPESLNAVVLTVVAFYFGTRAEAKFLEQKRVPEEVDLSDRELEVENK